MKWKSKSLREDNMLFKASDIEVEVNHAPETTVDRKTSKSIRVMDSADVDDDLVLDVISSPDMLGAIDFDSGTAKHYYSSGAFNLVQLVLYVLRQIGPAHVLLASYSVSERAVTTLKNHVDKGDILSMRFLIDNRVRTISPKPFDHMITAFPGCVRCRTLHAKVALIWNDSRHVDIVCSQNATHNPKLERGTIYTSQQVFDFDKEVLEYEFEQGTD